MAGATPRLLERDGEPVQMKTSGMMCCDKPTRSTQMDEKKPEGEADWDEARRLGPYLLREQAPQAKKDRESCSGPRT